MATTFIPFDGWAPALSIFGEGWGTVNNLYQPFTDWRPWRPFTPVGSGSGIGTGPMVGSHTHVWGSGSGTTTAYVPDGQSVFTGSVTNAGTARLYVINPATGVFTDVSRAALYSASSFGWRFVSVGNDIWATNGIDPLQRRTNNAGLFADGAVSTFKPQPRFLKTVREHLVGANLSNAGRFQDEIVWSDADDATNFDAATGVSTSLAASKRLVSIPGQITGLLGGQYALAWKQRCIYYLEYTGDVLVFRPDVLSTNVGTAWPSSIVNTRYGIFFLGSDGFYRIHGLSEPVKVSTPGIDQYLIDSGFTQNLYNTSSLHEDTQAIGFQAPYWPMVGWALRTNYSTYGDNFALLYNPVNNTWVPADIGNAAANQKVTAMVERNYSLNNMYESLGCITYDVSNPQFCLCSNINDAPPKAPVIGMNFRPANFDTATRQGQSEIKSILPIFSSAFGIGGTPLTASITVEALLDPQNAIWKTETRLASERDAVSGAYPFQIAGRFFRVTINCAAEEFASFDGVFVDQELLT